jgi:hypothetical protein
MEPLKTIQKKTRQSQTNETTSRIIGFLTIRERAFVWRNNVLPVPLPGGGYRPGSKAGVPDIIGILPETCFCCGGCFIGVEVKTGRDKLRPEQEGFIRQATTLGAVILVVKNYEDFIEQWEKLKNRNKQIR